MFRDFSYLRARFLLSQQDALRCLEQELEELDKGDSDNIDTRVFLQSRQADISRHMSSSQRDRESVFEDVYKRLQRYGKICTWNMTAYSLQLTSQTRPGAVLTENPPVILSTVSQELSNDTRLVRSQ